MDVQPEAMKAGLIFWPIPDTTPMDATCGLALSQYFDRRALPEVPRQYEEAVTQLFFQGGHLPALAKGVDIAKARRRLQALLRSFEPAHEAKIATAAYALWVWSTPYIVENVK